MEQARPTGGAVVEFLSIAAARGDMNANTAGAMRAAVKEVLGCVHNDGWEDVDVSRIDLDQYAERFARLRSSKFKAQSLTVYMSRFKKAVQLYLAWRNDPAGWTYAPGRSQKGRSRPRPKQPPPQSGAYQSSGGAQMIDYPYPLREGLIVTLSLPADLTRQEARRLEAYVNSLPLEEQRALSATPHRGDPAT